MNFASRSICRKCSSPKSGGAIGGGGGDEGGVMLGNGGGAAPGGEEGHQHQQHQPHPTKPGDWYCPSCRDLNFASRSVCRKCQTPHPDHSNARPGDWLCRNCTELNFASRLMCRKCNSPHPRPAPHQFFGNMGMNPMAAIGGMGHGFPGFFGLPQHHHHHHQAGGPHFGGGGGGTSSHAKPGDWYCLKCNELNFASRTACRSCQTPFQTNQPRVGVKSGDWLCSKCADLNFASRTACRKCGVPREEAGAVDALTGTDSSAVAAAAVGAPGGADLGEIAEQ